MMDDNKKHEMLCLHPKELTFDGPFDHVMWQKVVLANPSKDSHVSFKLKPTTMKMFIVRPNVGVLGPGKKVTVDFLVMPIGPGASHMRSKFIFKVVVASGNVTDLQEFWRIQNSDIWETEMIVELVPDKSSKEHFDFGGDVKEDSWFNGLEGNESVVKLLKWISVLEEERRFFMEGTTRMGNKKRNQGIVVRPQQGIIYFSCGLLVIVAAISGAYYGKHYL